MGQQTRYEYKTVTSEELNGATEQDFLNTMGSQGWRLVTVTAVSTTFVETQPEDVEDDDEPAEYVDTITTYYFERVLTA